MYITLYKSIDQSAYLSKSIGANPNIRFQIRKIECIFLHINLLILEKSLMILESSSDLNSIFFYSYI